MLFILVTESESISKRIERKLQLLLLMQWVSVLFKPLNLVDTHFDVKIISDEGFVCLENIPDNF